ncbi:hypothetical protein AAP_04863 [Ascosphaera apis ARSEF 7405]|uniref:Uncharacterized protein n=1 Tax=Ascosphaera apis ARSEF 7405 TaxID=392613 RepID=A0A166N9N7_9EURO|nr:hypothetical protein AAP_04863 [Ascosphaera apis ARSEF 7405]
MVAFRAKSVPAPFYPTQPREGEEYGSGDAIFATQQRDINTEGENREQEEEDEESELKRRRLFRLAESEDAYEAELANERFIRRKMRWHYFFTFSNDKVRTFIHRTMPELKDDVVRNDAYERFLRGTTREWKYESLKRMKNFVANEIRNQKTAPGLGLACTDEYRHLHEYFYSTFDEDNFYQVLYWLKNVIELEGSSELGKWYAKEIFSNLAVKCKIYLSKVERGDADAASYWEEVKLFWAAQGTNEKLAGVGKEHFKERIEKPKKTTNKTAKARQQEKIRKLHREFVVSPRPGQ